MPEDRDAATPAVTPFPRGSVVVHIGPHKTGTTAIQDAAAHRRRELAAAGVVYPGKTAHHSAAARAVGGRSWGWEARGDALAPDPAKWTALADAIRATDDTVLISSEFFSELETEAIERLVRDVGADRVQVVVTLRPLARLMPSSWQQHLKGGLTRSFNDWLTNVLSDPPNPRVTPIFWHRQDHPAVVKRWAEVAGADRVTVVVVDDSRRDALPRTFEQLLDVPEGSFAPAPGVRTNRSMTRAECELVRKVNVAIAGEAVGWTNYERVFRNAGVLRMVENRVPGDSEGRLAMPRWAVERANAIGATAGAAIRSLGVRVVGDLGLLATAPLPARDDAAAPAELPIDAAAELAIGIVSGAVSGKPYLPAESVGGKLRTVAPRESKDGSVADLPLREVTTPELARALRTRVTNGLRRRLRRR